MQRSGLVGSRTECWISSKGKRGLDAVVSLLILRMGSSSACPLLLAIGPDRALRVS